MTTTQSIFPSWIPFVVPESQKEDYEKALDNPVITYDDSIITLGTTRNKILDMCDEDIVVMVDDDVLCLYCHTGEKTERINDKEEAVHIIVNAAVMARDAGAKVFGFSQTDIRKYHGQSPFCLNVWIGTCIGVVGRKYRFADGRNKVDIDFCMQNLLVERIVWQDVRYRFENVKNANRGGASCTKTRESEESDYEYLFSRWGKYLHRAKTGKQNRKIKSMVKRKQSVRYE